MVIAALIFTGLALYWYFNIREGWQTPTLWRDHASADAIRHTGGATKATLAKAFISMCGKIRRKAFDNKTESNLNHLKRCALKWCTGQSVWMTPNAEGGYDPTVQNPNCVSSCAWQFPTLSRLPDQMYTQHWNFCMEQGTWWPRSTINRGVGWGRNRGPLQGRKRPTELQDIRPAFDNPTLTGIDNQAQDIRTAIGNPTQP